MSNVPSSAPSLEESLKHREENDVEKQPPQESGTEPVNPYHPSQFPDGGKDALLCLLGGFCSLFCSFGWLNCVGVFQSYYQTHQLRQYSPSTIAWIASCEIFVMFFPGPIIGFMFDNYGPRYLLLFGTFFHVLGLMMTSLCTEYWQFILAQAICSPIGLNCIFNASTSSLTTWWMKKRGAAYGIMAAGSGLGGVIFPIMTNHLIPKIGFGWTMRTSAFIILGLLIISNLTIKSRLPPKPRKFELQVFIQPLKDIKFVTMVAGSFFFFMGLFIPIDYIEVQALQGGMSPNLAHYLIPILNAASIFGRIIPGILADKVGRFNMQIAMTVFSCILVLALWLPTSNNSARIAFAALYGFASGAFIGLAPAQMAHISKVEEIGVRVGVMFCITSFAGLAGSPIAGAIITASHGSYRNMQIFVGVLLFIGSVLFIFARATVAGFKLARV